MKSRAVDAASNELNELITRGNDVVGSVDLHFRNEYISNEFTQSCIEWRARCIFVLGKIDKELKETFEKYGAGSINESLQIRITSWDMNQRPTNMYDPRADVIANTKRCLSSQIGILIAASKIVESVLFDFEREIAFDVKTEELLTAAKLIAEGQVRLAGAVIGIVTEGHLKSVLQKTGEPFDRDKMTLGPLLDKLKVLRVLDGPTYARGQFIMRVRNECVHAGSQEPKIEDVKEAAEAASKVIRDTV